MKRFPLLLGLFVLLCFAACDADKPDLPESIEINFFYDEPCATCDPLPEFYELINQEIGDVKTQYAYEVHTYNVFQTGDAAVRDQVLSKLGFGQQLIDTMTYPLMTINGNVYPGWEAIEESLREAYLTAGEDLFVYQRGVYDPTRKQTIKQMTQEYLVDKNASTIVYFYRTVCEECQQTDEELIHSLPETVMVDGKETKLNIIRINTRSGRNGDLMRAFCTAYNVPDEEQMVPTIFTSEGYLAGYDAIAASLMAKLESGAGLAFEMPE